MTLIKKQILIHNKKKLSDQRQHHCKKDTAAQLLNTLQQNGDITCLI